MWVLPFLNCVAWYIRSTTSQTAIGGQLLRGDFRPASEDREVIEYVVLFPFHTCPRGCPTQPVFACIAVGLRYV